MTIKEIEKFIGADSLAYLSLDGLKKASRVKSNKLCASCFDGKYPMPVEGGFRKDVFEKININTERSRSMKKLAILISEAGTGTNLQAIIDAVENKN